tara:strand:+ start:388 stop:822 length:435 start_codon:yes stop_codon:yes gene_type:complete
MIKYALICKSCKLEFESWFGSSKEFDRLKKMKLLNCQSCNSIKVEKSLMSPNLSNNKKKISNPNELKFQEVKQKLREYKKFVKNNFNFVGENFVYEARSLHYNKNKNKNNKKGVYGRASIQDVKELKEEGIETEILPWIEDRDN